MSDNVEHPSHYGGKDDPYETIKVLRAKLLPQEFCGALKFQVMKYNDRHVKKNKLEDLEKALWYQAYLVAYVEEVGHDVIWPKKTPFATQDVGREIVQPTHAQPGADE